MWRARGVVASFASSGGEGEWAPSVGTGGIDDHFDLALRAPTDPRLQVALERLVGVERPAAGLPRGHADLHDQLRRVAGAVARGEAGECDATLEVAGALRPAPDDAVAGLRPLADRVAATPTGLIGRRQSAAGPCASAGRA